MKPEPESARAKLWLLSGALLLYPAFLNGYPLMFPDGVDYLYFGRGVLRKLLTGQPSHYGIRSEVFSLSMCPFSLCWSFWPAILFNAVLVTGTIYLLFQKRARVSAAMLLFLSLFSTLPWHVSQVMPDYLTGLIPVWIFLLLSPRPRAEQILLAVALAYALLSHASHLVLGLALLGALVLVLPRKQWFRLLPTCFATLTALAFQLLLSLALYGSAHLFNPNAPPFLLARVLADGTGLHYLRDHPEDKLAPFLPLIKPNADQVLWSDDGLIKTLQRKDPSLLRTLSREQWHWVGRVVSAYPVEQARACLANFERQLRQCNLETYWADPYIVTGLDLYFPGESARYERSAQARGTLPLEEIRRVLKTCMLLSAAAIALFLGKYRLSVDSDSRLLLALVVVTLLVNAAVTGIISCPHPRYQSRVIWLLPLAAMYLWSQRPTKIPLPVDNS